MTRMSGFVLTVTAFTTVACNPLGGPSKSVTGTWQMRERWSVYALTITQSGDRITGQACLSFYRYSSTAVSSVIGDYPDMQFQSPISPSCVYRVKYEEDRDQIAGDCRPGAFVRFNRSQNGDCAAVNSQPLP